MKRFLLAAPILALLTDIAAAAIPNTDHPQTFLGPTLKGIYADALREGSAFSLLGEYGVWNFRAGGSLGFSLDVNQRFKFSGDFLAQRITYPFYAGNTDEWVKQGSIGAGYQFDFDQYTYQPQFNVNAYLSHSQSKNITPVLGNVTAFSMTQLFTNDRRIAGANAGGIAPGVGFRPWMGGQVFLDVNYDKVKYDTWLGPSHDALGFGGTVRLSQAMSELFTVGATASVRKPFNYYEANVTTRNMPYLENWNVGFLGAYTVGKNTMPNTYNFFMTFDLSVDRIPSALKQPTGLNPQTKLTQWMSIPAVYPPQVYAVSDQAVRFTSTF